MPKNSSIGKCALCTNLAILQLSHIIPAWAYKQVKEQGQYIQRSDDHTTAGQGDQRVRLLCRSCEGHMKVYDDLARAFYDDLNRIPEEMRGSAIGVAAFGLSVLWRFGAANPGAPDGQTRIINTLRSYFLERKLFMPNGVLAQITYNPDAFREMAQPRWFQIEEGPVFTFAVPRFNFEILVTGQKEGTILVHRSTDMLLVGRRVRRTEIDAKGQRHMERVRRKIQEV